MTRRDDAGELLEGDGAEDTMLDSAGDNTGDAGDRYRGSCQFGTTAAEEARGQSLDQRLAEEEPDPVEEEPEPEWSEDGPEPEWSDDRRQRREVAQLVTGGGGSHSRTDPDLVGLERGDAGLSAEEAALHPVELPTEAVTADRD